MRIDSTTAKGYLEITPEGLFQLGHSKDHRPDLPQVKINLSVLDPLGLPLTTTVVAGQRADDPLYLPEIKRVQQSLGRSGVTYIGDCKMAAKQTRAAVAASSDYYLCPLTKVQVSQEDWGQLLAVVRNRQQPLTSVYRSSDPSAEPEKIATGYESSLALRATVDGRTLEWRERRLVVRSLKLAKGQEEALRRRVEQALEAILGLNERRQGKKRWSQEAKLDATVQRLVVRYRVRELIQWQISSQVSERVVRGYRDRPRRVVQERVAQVSAQVDEAVLAQAIERLGWRVYASNQPAEQLSLEQAVLAYRAEYLVNAASGASKANPCR